MESRFFLDVVVRKGAAVFELLSGEDEALLIRWDTFLVLNLGSEQDEQVKEIVKRMNWLT